MGKLSPCHIVFLWGVVAPAVLSSQTLEARSRLAGFDRQLAALGDSAEVRRIGRAVDARRETDSLAELESVLALLRLNQLGDPWAARQAVGLARKATERHPDWPVAWLLSGQALLVEGKRKELDPRELGRRVGFGEYEDAVVALDRAVTLEPTLVRALLDLERAVMETRDTGRIAGVLLPAFRAAREAGVNEPSFLLYLGRTERGFGTDERAREAFHAYLEAGGHRGIGLHELAWTAFALGDESASDLYYEGAVEDDAASVAAYRGDLALLVSDEVLATYDLATGEGREAWLRQFWEDRDREALRSPGERLAEHFRRMTAAERRFLVQANRRLDSESLYWSGIYACMGGARFGCREDRDRQQGEGTVVSAVLPAEEPVERSRSRDPDAGLSSFESLAIQTRSERIYGDSPRPEEQFDAVRFDQRGLIYIRQGEPDTVISTVAWGVERNETWQYRRPDGDLMLHFGNVPEDLRFRTSLSRIRSDGNTARWFLYNDRCSIYPQYCKYLTWGPYGRKKLLDKEEQVVVASIAVAKGTDAYDLRFPRGLEFEAAAFAAGRAGSQGLVHVTWRFRPGPLAVGEPGAIVPVPTRVRVALLDTLGHAVNWRDTTLTVRVRAGDTTVAQVGRLGMSASPGSYIWRVALSVGDSIGGIPPRGTVNVPGFAPGAITLSDLLIATRGEGAPWLRPDGDTAYVTPRSAWFRDSPLTLYHEIYGLAEGESYTSSLALKRGKRIVLTASYAGTGSLDVTHVYRTLSLAGVSPGDYLLEISVKGETGPWVRRTREITVRKPE